MDEANGYAFSAAAWNGTRGIGAYGYVFSEDYPFIMPGYFGADLHPAVALKGSRLSAVGAAAAVFVWVSSLSAAAAFWS